MVDKEMLEAMAQLLNPINERLDRMEMSVGQRFEKMEMSVGERFEKMEMSVGERFEKMEMSVGERLDKIEEETRHTRVLVEGVNKNPKLMCEAQQETSSKFKQLDRIEMTLNDVKSDTEVIKDVVRWHSGDIRNLKTAL